MLILCPVGPPQCIQVQPLQIVAVGPVPQHADLASLASGFAASDLQFCRAPASEKQTPLSDTAIPSRLATSEQALPGTSRKPRRYGRRGPGRNVRRAINQDVLDWIRSMEEEGRKLAGEYSQQHCEELYNEFRSKCEGLSC